VTHAATTTAAAAAAAAADDAAADNDYDVRASFYRSIIAASRIFTASSPAGRQPHASLLCPSLAVGRRCFPESLAS